MSQDNSGKLSYRFLFVVFEAVICAKIARAPDDWFLKGAGLWLDPGRVKNNFDVTVEVKALAIV
jgi:hypothetical protein